MALRRRNNSLLRDLICVRVAFIVDDSSPALYAVSSKSKRERDTRADEHIGEHGIEDKDSGEARI